MQKVRLALAVIIATTSPLTGHAAPQASVRLDFPPGYLTSKPAVAQKASSTLAPDDCTANCTNFDDGYAWAQARSFKNEEQCRGRSRAFVEGCMIYVSERKKCGGNCR